MKEIADFDYNLVVQSAPSLFISLVGLFYTGNILEENLKTTNTIPFPTILISSCILSFKGNIELIYALYTSSYRLNIHNSFQDYIKYTFDNANLLLLQSTTIGLVIGIIGITKSISNDDLNIHNHTFIIVTTLCACLSTTFLFILALVLTTEISVYLNISLDDFILPFIGALTDYLSVKFLLIFTNVLYTYSFNTLTCTLFCLLLPSPLYMFFICKSNIKMPVQSVKILGITYILCTISGYILDFLSQKYMFLASSSPVYSGIATSIAFIYLHKKFLINEHGTKDETDILYKTLLTMACVVILFYTVYDVHKTWIFYCLFVIFFVFQVFLLLKVIDLMSNYLSDMNDATGIIILPLLTGLSDILSTLFLTLICYLTIKSDLSISTY